MIGEDDVIDVARRITWHVACGATVPVGLPRRSRAPAIGGLMATQAFAPEVRGFLVCIRNGMGVVARAAPQLLPARPFAGALREVLHVARDPQRRGRSGAHENCKRVCEHFTRTKVSVDPTRL